MKRYADDFDDEAIFGGTEPDPPPSRAKTIIYTACGVIAAALGVAVVVWFAAGKAHGHSWYPPVCCSDRDCGPVDENILRELPNGAGYLVLPTKEIIRYNDPRIKGFSPDGMNHRCAVDGAASNSRTLCIYPKGSGS